MLGTVVLDDGRELTDVHASVWGCDPIVSLARVAGKQCFLIAVEALEGSSESTQAIVGRSDLGVPERVEFAANVTLNSSDPNHLTVRNGAIRLPVDPAVFEICGSLRVDGEEWLWSFEFEPQTGMVVNLDCQLPA